MQQFGRPSGFYGKFLGEIVRSLKDFGVGRYVVKKSELDYKEPCYYLLTRVEPYLPDQTCTRVRAWGNRIYRGRKISDILIDKTHEPDWCLVLRYEERKLLEQELTTPPLKVIDPLYPYPPLLSMSVKNQPEGIRYDNTNGEPLLLIRPFYYPEDFIKLEEIDESLRPRVWPPIEYIRKDGEFRFPYMSNNYYIQRPDAPDLKWKVELIDIEPKEANN